MVVFASCYLFGFCLFLVSFHFREPMILLIASPKGNCRCCGFEFVVIAETWWDCNMGFPSTLEVIILWQLLDL
jgi:hypothetical protein